MDNENESNQPGARLLLALLFGLTAVILLLVIYALPPLAANARATIRTQDLATARAIAATARAPLPTPTPGLRATAVPTPTIPLRSGGIGLPRDRWEIIHGSPDPRSGRFVVYGNGTFIVDYEAGRLWFLEKVWRNGETVKLADARLNAAVLMPLDSVLAKTSEQTATRLTEHYTSADMLKVLTAERSSGKAPDTIIVTYHLRDGIVTAITLAVEEPQQ